MSRRESALTHKHVLDVEASKSVKWIAMGAVIDATAGEIPGIEVTLNNPEELEAYVNSVAIQVERVLRGHRGDGLLPIAKEILKNLR